LLWLLAGLGALALLAVLIGGIGSAMPKAYSVSRRAQFNRSRWDVWRTITDYRQQVTWRDDVRHVERLSNRGGMEVWRETGRRQPLVFETVESSPPRRLVRRIANEGLAFGGSWAFDIEEVGEVTVVTVTEEGEVYNPFLRFVSRVIVGQAAAIDGYLRALGEKLGADVFITRA
jgi:hypothetical protein